MNTKPCSQCLFYDPQVIFTNNRKGYAAHGWCAKKSVYPQKEEYDQTFPPDVQRREQAKPVIVWGDRVVANCVDVLVK
jgi:hypothetical protein